MAAATGGQMSKGLVSTPASNPTEPDPESAEGETPEVGAAEDLQPKPASNPKKVEASAVEPNPRPGKNRAGHRDHLHPRPTAGGVGSSCENRIGGAFLGYLEAKMKLCRLRGATLRLGCRGQ